MTKFARFFLVIFLFIGINSSAVAAYADPANRKSERTERFGYWYVVKKPASYVIASTGRRGRYTLCSAVMFTKSASLEFEAKNSKAWAFYVAKEGWDYRFGTKKLSLRSGSQEIRIPAALYGGSMISGMSHNLQSGRPISMETLQALISRGQPISFYDNRGKNLVTFPNDGADLAKAFASAIRCSLANAPK